MKKLEKLSNEELLKRMKNYRPIIIALVAFMFITLITLLVLRMNHLYAIFTLIPMIPVYYRFNQYLKESRRRNLN